MTTYLPTTSLQTGTAQSDRQDEQGSIQSGAEPQSANCTTPESGEEVTNAREEGNISEEMNDFMKESSAGDENTKQRH